MDDKTASTAAVRSLETKVKVLKQSIQDLIRKLERQDTLPWSDMLDNFAELSGQSSNLLRQLKTSSAGMGMFPSSDYAGMQQLRNLTVFPIHLSLEHDAQLQQLTEGRVSAWTHAVPPDYLRTNPIPQLVEDEREVIDRLKQGNTDQRQAAAMTKVIDNMEKSLSDITSSIERKGYAKETSSDDDTARLVRAVLRGDGLKANVGPVGAGGKGIANDVNAGASPVGGGKYPPPVVRGKTPTHPYQR